MYTHTHTHTFTFGKIEILVVFLPGIPLVLVGGEIWVKMRSDGPYSSCPNCRQREKSVLPKSRVENALVVIEQTGNPSRDQRRYAKEVACRIDIDFEENRKTVGHQIEQSQAE